MTRGKSFNPSGNDFPHLPGAKAKLDQQIANFFSALFTENLRIPNTWPGVVAHAVILALWEVEMGASIESRSLRTA